MNLMGIDFGEKRIGLAIAESDLAVPLETLTRTTDRIIVAKIAALAKQRNVVELVLGEPLGLGGGSSTATERVRRFGAKLEKRSGLPVTYVDEALTSREAEARLKEASVDIGHRKGAVDAMAAAILLQQELDRRRQEKDALERKAVADAEAGT